MYKIIKENWNISINGRDMIAFSLWNWKLKYYIDWGGIYTADTSNSEVYINGKLKTNY